MKHWSAKCWPGFHWWPLTAELAAAHQALLDIGIATEWWQFSQPGRA